MEDLISLIVSLLKSDPIKAVAVLLVLICTVLFLELKKRFSRDITRFEVSIEGFGQKMNYWETQIRNHMGQTGKDLLKHSDDLGKATKAINGDMLKIQETVFNLKQSLIDEIEKLKEFAAELHRDFLEVAQTCRLSVAALEEKFGRVVVIKKELETVMGKIIQVEENTGKQSVRIAKHDQFFGTLAKTVESHKETLSQMRVEIDKIKRGKA